MRVFGPVDVLVVMGANVAAQQPPDTAIARFYEAPARWLQPAWMSGTGLTPQATALLDAVARASDEGLDPDAYITPALHSGARAERATVA